jgi:hypothetical protein
VSVACGFRDGTGQALPFRESAVNNETPGSAFGKWIKSISRVVSAIIFILGLASIPANAVTWLAWLSVIGPEWVRITICVFGLGLLVWANDLPSKTVALCKKLRHWSSELAHKGSLHLEPDKLPPLQCPQCGGTALQWGTYQIPCPRCRATGEIPGEIGLYPKCKPCNGTGCAYGTYQQDCEVCRGWGRRLPIDLLTKVESWRRLRF